MITITVNGKERELEREMPLVGYLQLLGMDLRLVAVAHNGSVLRKDELTSVTLANGDSIEVVHAVGGG